MLNNPIPLISFTTDKGPKKEQVMIFAEVQWFRTPGCGSEGQLRSCAAAPFVGLPGVHYCGCEDIGRVLRTVKRPKLPRHLQMV